MSQPEDLVEQLAKVLAAEMEGLTDAGWLKQTELTRQEFRDGAAAAMRFLIEQGWQPAQPLQDL